MLLALTQPAATSTERRHLTFALLGKRWREPASRVHDRSIAQIHVDVPASTTTQTRGRHQPHRGTVNTSPSEARKTPEFDAATPARAQPATSGSSATGKGVEARRMSTDLARRHRPHHHRANGTAGCRQPPTHRAIVKGTAGTPVQPAHVCYRRRRRRRHVSANGCRFHEPFQSPNRHLWHGDDGKGVRWLTPSGWFRFRIDSVLGLHLFVNLGRCRCACSSSSSVS